MDRIILLTGGSRGLGAKLVERLCENSDNKVYFTYFHSPEKALELEYRFSNATAVKCDQRKEEDVKRCVLELNSIHQRIDGLVNNACPLFKPCDLLLSDWEAFQDILDTNVKGSYFFTREAGKIMKQNGHGRIINILSSYVFNLPPEKIAFYVTAKYALLGLSKASAVELSKYGCTVNMVSPGLMCTDLSGYLPRKYLEVYSEKHPRKRMTTTDDVVDVLEFLLSDRAQFLNGVNIPVNGGESF